MKITKSQLQRIIKEEVVKILMERNFDPKTGEPLSDKGWKMAAQNPESPFYEKAKHKERMAAKRAKHAETLGAQSAKHAKAQEKSQGARENERALLKQAMDAENKCMDWALEDPERKAITLKHMKQLGSGMPPEIMKICPHKASEEAQNLLNKVRDRKNRAMKGQAPADDDKSELAKIRRRVHRVQQGLPPADDDTSALAKARRGVHAKTKGKK